MRRAVILLATLAGLGASLAGTAAAAARPTFTGPTALPGSAGSSEPRVAFGPDGTEYVVSGPSTDSSAPSAPVRVYVSRDRGRTWKPTPADPVQVQPTADVDIVVTRTGRLVVAELDSAGLNVVISYSDDGGRTWSASSGAHRLADQDRPWIAVGPDDPSTHQPRVYLLFHNAFSGSANENMYVETSSDGGATFGAPVPLTLPGSPAYLDLQCGDTGGPASLLVNQRTGRLYAFWPTRHGPAGGCGVEPPQPVTIVAPTRVWVATSPDNSTGSWTTSLAVDDSAKGNVVAMQMAPGALDRAGNVYVVYPESQNAFPDFSGAAVRVRHAPADLARWSAPITVSRGVQPGNVLTHIVAGDPGRLDVAYFAGEIPAAGKAPLWHMTVAQVTGALGGAPSVRVQRIQALPAFQGGAADLMGWCDDTNPANQSVPACLNSRAADVWGIALDRQCRLAVSWPSISAASDPGIGASVDATWTATQSGGPTLCGSAAGRPPARAGACRVGAGRVGARSLGPVSLGERRSRIRHAFPGFATRRRLDMDFLCSPRRGIRVGYPSPRLLGRLPRATASRVRGRVVIILTADPAYAVDGLRPGSRLAARHLGPAYAIGANTWYLPSRRGGRAVLKARGGVVQEVGLVDPRLTTTRTAARAFLASFG